MPHRLGVVNGIGGTSVGQGLKIVKLLLIYNANENGRGEKMEKFETCPLHPDHRKRYRCERFGIEVCDHPDCLKCPQPYSLCPHRKTCAIWANQGKKR